MPYLLERIFKAFLFVAISCHVDNIKCTAAKDRVFLHQFAQSFGFFYTRNYPESMAEQIAVFFVGIRIVTIWIVLCDKL
ncbi:hypothetical protein HMPREF0262_02403 [Clostridium sp. ATCC 29733]|nr:hypothetical protein HMPREF0262_02403 [Clostridium sp. ATCC 29733]